MADFLLLLNFVVFIPFLLFVSFLVTRTLHKFYINPVLNRLPDLYEDEQTETNISFYRKALNNLNFSYYGDFEIKCITRVDLISSIYFNESLSVVAYINRDKTNKRIWFEFSTYFSDGTEVNSIDKNMRVSNVVTGKHTYLYPEVFPQDLLKFHLKKVEEFNKNPVWENNFENLIIKSIVQDNAGKIEKGYLTPDKKGEFLKISLEYFFKGAVSELSTNTNIVPLTEYSGEIENNAIITKEWPKFPKYIIAAYFLAHLAAPVYKYFFMHPDPAGYFIFLWLFVLIISTFFGFLSKEPSLKNIVSFILYFLLMVILVPVMLWSEHVPVSIMFLQFALTIVVYNQRKGKEPSKKMNPFVYLILPLMVVSMFYQIKFLNYFYNFITINPEKVHSITLYDYEKGENFKKNEPILVIEDRNQIKKVVNSLIDTTPYSPNHESIQKPILAEVVHDGKVSHLLLGKGNSANNDVVWIEFIEISQNNYSGLSSNGVYQNKMLFEALSNLNIEKWKEKEE